MLPNVSLTLYAQEISVIREGLYSNQHANSRLSLQLVVEGVLKSFT